MDIEAICVCGAGTMGSGIALLAAQHGIKSIQYDVSADMLDKSKTGIEKILQSAVAKGRMTQAEQKATLQHLFFTTDVNGCKADVVIEAIVENESAKAGLINQLAVINTSKTIFATNTSSLSVSRIASLTNVAERVVGMHFFNPAHLMKLVEVVEGDQTQPQVTQAVVELSRALGKTPVVCKDQPGFIVNRVARHYYLEALRMVENNEADVETIDEILEASGFKMGPFKLMDLIGMDINLKASEKVYEALGQPSRLKPSELQQQKVAAGELGRKSGKGFYKY